MFNLLGRKLAEAPAGGAPADCSYPARQGPISAAMACLALPQAQAVLTEWVGNPPTVTLSIHGHRTATGEALEATWPLLAPPCISRLGSASPKPDGNQDVWSLSDPLEPQTMS